MVVPPLPPVHALSRVCHTEFYVEGTFSIFSIFSVFSSNLDFEWYLKVISTSAKTTVARTAVAMAVMTEARIMEVVQTSLWMSTEEVGVDSGSEVRAASRSETIGDELVVVIVGEVVE
jgi:hypothetical protein